MSSKEDQPITDDHLQAFVDDQLDGREKSMVFEALKEDKSLSNQVCELRQLRELVRHAYEQPPQRETAVLQQPARLGLWRRAAVASLLLAIDAGLGWMGHTPADAQDTGPEATAMYWDEDHSFQNADLTSVTGEQSPKKVIVHLNTSSPEKFENALNTAEKLLKNYADNDRGAEIEVVANASAVKMLRSGYSPYAQRVRDLQQQYINLTFLACKDAIDHVREIEGPDSSVRLLPDVEVTPSALEHILERLSEGWVYLNV